MISLFETVKQRSHGRPTIHVRHNCRCICSICRCFVYSKSKEVSIKVNSIRRTKIITYLDSILRYVQRCGLFFLASPYHKLFYNTWRLLAAVNYLIYLSFIDGFFQVIKTIYKNYNI